MGTFIPGKLKLIFEKSKKKCEFFSSNSQGAVADEHTFFGYYFSWFVQFGGGVSYMAIFGVVLAMEIGFCKFVNVSFNDLKHICTSLNNCDLNNKELSKKILKEAFELHQEILKYLNSFWFFFCSGVERI